MPTGPLISVIVPVLNRAELVGEAIDSILEQDCAPLEIVVVDDGSNDGSADVAQTRGGRLVRCVRQEHKGVSAARNLGLEHARGDLIAFLDSDDLWTKGSLRARCDLLAQRPEAGIVFGRTLVRNTVTESRRFSKPRDEPLQNRATLGSILCRQTVFGEVGYFDESLEHAEDIDWMVRVQEAGIELVPLDATVLEYRIHGGNMTWEVERNHAYLFRALKRSLDRRRGK